MMNLDSEINNILKYAGVQLTESEMKSLEVDNLMAQYERAKEDYEASDFYDDYKSWHNGRNSAESQMKEINSKLIELTGKSYDELLDSLGSKEVREDKGPKLKIGDEVTKNGRKYKVEKIDKHEYKSRGLQSTSYFYHLKQIDGPYLDIISDSDLKN